MWKGTLTFGLVSVPVKLYTAVSERSVRFHQLHATDHARIVQKRFCAAEEEEVPFSEVVKGYEIAPGRHVVIEAEEFAALEPAFTRTIEIEDFVQMEEIDPILFDRPYYLVPNRGGARSYRLLLQAMRDTDKVAIGRVVLRSRQQLVAIHPREDALVMTTMNFGDEVVPTSELHELHEDHVELSDNELEIAHRLVDSIARPFDVANYRDTYREALLDLIDRKASGEQVVLEPPARDQPLEAPDLMSALEASIEQVRARRAREEEVLSVDGAPPAKRAKAPAKRKTKQPQRSTEAARAQLKEQPQNQLLAGAVGGGLDAQLVGHTLQHAAHSGQHRISDQLARGLLGELADAQLELPSPRAHREGEMTVGGVRGGVGAERVADQHHVIQAIHRAVRPREHDRHHPAQHRSHQRALGQAQRRRALVCRLLALQLHAVARLLALQLQTSPVVASSCMRRVRRAGLCSSSLTGLPGSRPRRRWPQRVGRRSGGGRRRGRTSCAPRCAPHRRVPAARSR